jgi:S-adenosylmethionine/arginine decarboxylase-like enzyme
MHNKRKTVKHNKKQKEVSYDMNSKSKEEKEEEETFWGYHLMLNCKNCDKSTIQSKTHIATFLKKLIEMTDMVAWGKPKFMDLETGEHPELYGISVVQLIHTSSITIHFMNQTGDVYFDFFSCKKFEPKKVVECFRYFFKPTKVQPIFLIRDTNMD